MIIRRFVTALRQQDWTTVTIEFLIVVAGILVGLQINDWNQARLDAGLRDSYYQELIADLKSDLESASRTLKTSLARDAEAETIIAAYEDRGLDSITDEQLATHLVTAGWAIAPRVSRRTFEELRNTGGIRVFDDKELKNKITRYYQATAFGRQWDDVITEKTAKYDDAINGVLTPDQSRWVIQRLNGVADGPLPHFDRAEFLRKLRSNQEIRERASAMALIQERYRVDATGTARLASELIAALESALSK